MTLLELYLQLLAAQRDNADNVAELQAQYDTARTEASDDDLAAHDADLVALFSQVRDGEADGFEARDVATLGRIAAATQQVRADVQARTDEQARIDAEIAQLEAQLAPEAGTDPDPEAGGDNNGGGEPTDPPAADPPADPPAGEPTDPPPAEPAEPEAVAAGAGRPALGRVQTRGGGRPSAPAPVVVDPHVSLVAAGHPRPAADFGQLATQMAEVFRTQTHGNSRKTILATLHGDWPTERTLTLGDAETNARRVQAVVEQARQPNAFRVGDTGLTAAGWCTPSPVQYDQRIQAGAARPVRDSLPGFSADRGGVRLPVSPTLSVIQDDTEEGSAIGIYTEADADDSDYTKPIQAIDCPDWVDFRTYMVVRRLRFENGAARAYPENVAAWTRLALAAHARRGDGMLLRAMKRDAGTTTLVNPSNIFGAARDVVELILRLTTFMRSAERQTDSELIRAELPFWLVQLMQADLSRTQRDGADLVATEEYINRQLGNAGVNTTFYIDTPMTSAGVADGPSQILSRQTTTGDAAPLLWPCDIQFGLHFEGHYLFLQQPDIDLGVVRDSALNEVNDYETFAESTEGLAANRGPEALWVTQRLVPDGTYAAATDGANPIECAEGS